MINRRISRRAVLRGLGGVAMSLPWLEAMMPRVATAAAGGGGLAGPGAAMSGFPTRLAWVYIPQGAWMPDWMPQVPGGAVSTADYTMPIGLKPIEQYRDDVLVFGNISCEKAKPNGEGGGDHARSSGAYLTGTRPFKTAGTDFRTGVSVDQVAAKALGHQTRAPSLELAIEGFRGTGNCDNGFACVYETTLSWRDATTPLPPEVNPREVFNRLFAADTPQSKARRELRASVLDSVLQDAKTLEQQLGGSDKHKFDQYLTSVREIEQRIERAEKFPEVQLPDGVQRPLGVPPDLTEHIRLMCDIMVLAFQTDVTRISTFMLGREGSEIPYRMVGVTDGHHQVSHHQNNPQKVAAVKAISLYHMQQFAYLLGRMKSIKEGDGTLLDHTMLVYGSAIADPNAHAHDNLPTIVAGRAGGAIKPGRFVRYQSNASISNLWLTMLDRFGVTDQRFGDSTGLLPALT